MTPRYRGRTVLITGGGRGLGLAMGEQFADEQADVVLCDRDTEVTGVAEKLAVTTGASVTSAVVDITDADAVRSMTDDLVARHGKIDVLVNNAGVEAAGRIERLTPTDWHKVVDVCLTGTFHCIASVLPRMKERRYGRILSISSIARHGLFGASNYSAAKAGVVALARTVALEAAADGVTCNVIAPGPFDTPMLDAIGQEQTHRLVRRVPLGRSGRPAELAQAVAFLCSEAAGFITGAVLDVDGGASLLSTHG